MKIREIVESLEGELLVGDENVEIERVEASDLMSDVLAFFEEGTALITSLTSPQVIRTAVIVGVPLVVFVRGKAVPDEVLSMAEDSEIAIVRTEYSMFKACGILYSKGMKA